MLVHNAWLAFRQPLVKTLVGILANYENLPKRYDPPMDRVGSKTPTRHFLREWRESKGLTQQQLADRLETGKDQVSRFENYKRKMTLDAAAGFAKALGIDTLAIFRDPQQPSADEILKLATPEQRRQAIAILETLLKSA